MKTIADYKAEIERRLHFHEVSAEIGETMTEVRAKITALAHDINEVLPAGPEKDLFIQQIDALTTNVISGLARPAQTVVKDVEQDVEETAAKVSQCCQQTGQDDAPVTVAAPTTTGTDSDPAPVSETSTASGPAPAVPDTDPTTAPAADDTINPQTPTSDAAAS